MTILRNSEVRLVAYDNLGKKGLYRAVAPGDITVKYQLASIHAYSCFSADYITDSKTNKGKWTDLLADFGSWAGYHGSATHFSSLEVDDNSIDD